MAGKYPNREEIAKREIGRTVVSRGLAIALSVFFLAAVFLVPLGQLRFDRLHGHAIALRPLPGNVPAAFPAKVNRLNNTVLENIDIVEKTLEEQSFLRQAFLPPLQYVLLRFLGQGNDKAIPGRGGWLHFAPAVEYLTGPPFLDPDQRRKREMAHKLWEPPLHADPLEAIVDFQRQLARRGIELIVLPVPVKVAIHPEKLSARRVDGRDGTLANRSWPAFAAALRENGVRLFDARPVLARYAAASGDAYLATDTHWLPGAMAAVAGELARVIVAGTPGLRGGTDFQLLPQQVAGQGDLARMFILPKNTTLFAEQEVQLSQVTTGRQELWQPDPRSPVLLLGDSFANIYSSSGLGWGRGAGLAEQLSHALRLPVDLLARNDGGAYVTREMLAGELARGRDRLAGKRLVIWQFAERELAFGDWKKTELRLGEPVQSDFFVAPADREVEVTGVVAEVSRSPRPGAVPYRDNILTLHLVDLRSENGQAASGQALVYAWGMRDNRLTDLATLRPGDTVTLALTGWEAVEGTYGSYRRTALDDEMLELETPNWGTPIDEKDNK